MKNQLRRLRLKEGDIIVVRDEYAARALAETRSDLIKFPVPIVIIEGSVHRLSKEYLQKLLADAK